MLTEIVYEDREVLVARKPAGLAVQTARLGQQDMVSELKNYLGRQAGGSPGAGGKAEPYLGIVHRLDQPVEGLLVFAKNRDASRILAGQLQQGGEEGFSKHYRAVLCGIPARKEGELEDRLYKECIITGRQKEYRTVVVDPLQESVPSVPGKPPQGNCPRACAARLEYRILQESEETGLSLADIRLLTGRFHQIRAQMAHAGMPLLGDVKYGDEKAKALAQSLGIRFVALCAYRLEFAHPASGKRMEFLTEPKTRAFSFFSQL